MPSAPLTQNHIALAQGATGVLDALAYILCEEGDEILCPAPYYGGFRRDIETRSKVKLRVVGGDGRLVDRLKGEHNQSIKEGKTVRAVLITNPGNPDGKILESQIICDVISWARTLQLHVLMDEAYALSIHSEKQFMAATEILKDRGGLGDDVHVIWALSKDFGLSGLRVGVLYSQNMKVICAARQLARLHGGMDNDTYHWVSRLLSDQSFIRSFLERNAKSLRVAYQLVTQCLDRCQLPYECADAGVFVWVDIRRLMKGKSGIHVWDRFCENGVLLTPGEDCGQDDYIRVCFAAVTMDVLQVALGRFETAVKQILSEG